MIKRLFVLLLLALLAVIPAVAQDDEEDEAALDTETLDYIAAAFEAMNNLDSVRIVGELTVDQEVTSAGMTIPTTITQEIDGRIGYGDDSTVDQLQMTLLQELEMGMGLGSGGMTLEMRLVDGTFYVQVSNTSGLMVGQFPEEWERLSDESTSVIAEAFGDPEALIASFNQQIQYPITEETVIELDERRETDVDDDPVRRWDVVLDPSAIRDSGALEAALGRPPGRRQRRRLRQHRRLRQGSRRRIHRVYISTETDLIRQIDSEVVFDTALDIMGQSAELSQTAEGEFVYSEFNEPIEVEAPELE